jgi:hypothetical protein
MLQTMLQSIAMVEVDPSGTSIRILPIDIYGGREATTTFDVARALLAAVSMGADVVNLSLGGEEPSPVLHDAVRLARSDGTLVIAAAGNVPTVSDTFPAAFPEAIAVTSGDQMGRIDAYANRGPFVDLVGPGTSLLHFNNQAYIGTGTSYATAYIAGRAASYQAAQAGTTLEQVEAYLHQHYGFQAP